MKIVGGIGRFWWDFVVGDDWKIAAAIGITLVVAAIVVAGRTITAIWVAPVIGVALAAGFLAALVADLRRG